MNKSTIEIRCCEDLLPEIEAELFSMEYINKPPFNFIVIETEDDEYMYRVKQEGNIYYIVTD